MTPTEMARDILEAFDGNEYYAVACAERIKKEADSLLEEYWQLVIFHIKQYA